MSNNNKSKNIDVDNIRWLQSVADCVSSTVIIKDRDHKYALVNEFFADLLGMKPEEIIGKDDFDVGIPPEMILGDGDFPGFRALDNEAILAGVPVTLDEPGVSYQNGEPRHMRTIRCPLTNDNGDVSHLLIVSNDITDQTLVEKERATQEKFLQVILDMNPGLIYAKDTSDRYVFMNKAMREAFGCSNQDSLNKTFFELTSDRQTSDALKKSDQELWKTLAKTEKSEVDYSFDGKSTRTYESYKRSLAIYSDEPDHIIGLYSDVTDQRTTLKLLYTEREQLARRNAFHSSLSSQIIVLLGADSSYISVVHESEDYIEAVASAGKNPTAIGHRHLSGEGIAGTAWQKGKMQVVGDYHHYDNRVPGFENIKQVCALPIKVEGEVVVVIGIVYHSVNDKLLERVGEFEEFAQQVTIVIENARLIESARTDLARTEALYKLSDALYQSYDTQTVLDLACRVVVQVCDAKRVQFYKKQRGGKISVSAEESAPYLADGTHANDVHFDENDVFKAHLTQKCFVSKEPLYISRSDSSAAISQAKKLNNIGSIICVPLVNDGYVWGVLMAYRDESKPDFTDRDTNLLSAIGNQASVALQRQRLLSKIEHQAYHDSLTKLPNRLKFEEELNEAVNRAKEENERLAVLFIDLDGFKAINDVFSHSVGDELLRSVSDRLRSMFDSKDLLCRMGGDEFAVLLKGVESLTEVMELSERTINELTPQYIVSGVTVSVGASIGISLFPDDSETAGNLLKNADIAMYQAKNKGKNCAQYFSNKMARRFKERIEIEKELGDAVNNQELELVYQPKVSISNKNVTGAEVLLRWNHPARGYISPSEFIPIAEESGLIIPIGDWVLEQACKQLVQWHSAGHNKLTVAVNVSLQQFSTGHFVEVVQRILQSTGLDAGFLNIELTESVVLVEVERTVKKLLTLQDMGVSVSIDDFGTGFSSLRYLQDLPLDFLKIDRSFIEKLDDTDPELSLVNTIIRMAESFGLDTVAEGVETEDQLQKVVGLGCDCIQGFLFSKPVKPEELLDTINSIEAGLFPINRAA